MRKEKNGGKKEKKRHRIFQLARCLWLPFFPFFRSVQRAIAASHYNLTENVAPRVSGVGKWEKSKVSVGPQKGALILETLPANPLQASVADPIRSYPTRLAPPFILIPPSHRIPWDWRRRPGRWVTRALTLQSA